MPDPASTFESAHPDTLAQIRKEADAYLGAQLTVTLAGNQRAMTFFGFLAAASAVIGSASVTVVTTSTDFAAFGVVGIMVVFGLLIAMFCANMAAMPDDFYYVGNSPSNWIEDIQDGRRLHRSLAEGVALDVRSIDRNTDTIDRCSKFIKRAVWIAWGSLAGGALGMIVAYSLTHP
ncbi:hypothetical protein ACFZ8E_04040 [Methylobacterium sp. HMF5984]|uniref:hypothetical protein n=1 Tax=Methylobacterium sp. HMF5984 TaxID=3367370 RepID=UPI003851AFAE